MNLCRFSVLSGLLATGVCLGVAVPAQAQEVAGGLMAHEAATTGTTDVASTGFETTDTKAAEAEATKNITEFQVSAGALTSSGNARLLSFTGASRFRARREANQLSMAAAGNYSRSAATADDDMQTTLRNVQGKIRYDRFLGQGFALFASLSGRNDKFQGLVLRSNFDPGLAYYFLDKEKHQLWTELGYDLQYDVRRDANLQLAAEQGQDLDKTDVRHSMRLFLGYNGSINDVVGLNTGLEYLQGLPETEYWRLNWDVGLTTSLSGKFSVATTFSLKYDNEPLPEVKNTDTVTAVNLVYQLL